jgi:WD40 repeat protein
MSDDGRRIAFVELGEGDYMVDPSRLLLLDRDSGATTHLASHGGKVWSVALNDSGTIVATGDRDGVVRVGRTDGSEPHLLLGHKGRIWSVDIDPLGRWIATGGQDGTVRIWPMPDLSKPPLHTLPHDELMAKLESLTNLRVVRDEDSPIGWTLTHDPFPGWETVPTW